MLTSIKLRMAVYVVATVTVVLLVLGILDYRNKSDAMHRQLTKQAELAATRMAISLPGFIWNFDTASIEKTMEAELEAPVVSRVAVQIEQGDTITREKDLSDNQSVNPDVIIKTMDLMFADGGEQKKVGTLIVGFNDSEILVALNSTVHQIIIQLVLLDVILVSMIVFLVSHSVVNKISAITSAVAALAAGGGDLTRRLDTSRGDEIAALAHQVNQLLAGLSQLIGSVKETSTDLSQIASKTQSDISLVLERFSDQKGEVDMVATASTELASATQNVAQNAGRASEYASQANEQADAGQEIVRTAADVIRHLSGEIENVSEVIRALEAEGASIGTVSDVIQGIAEQTNLLALNAAIEAARAGEQGRGFAVVADEVRTLAQRTRDSTNEINQMISRLQASTAEAVAVMHKSTSYTQRSVEQIEKVGESIGEVVGMVLEIARMNSEIAQASGEQSQVIDELNRNLVHIKESADAASELIGKTARASDAVGQEAGKLSALMKEFRV
ncbi:methyl-accepting chemotaxis protein [Thalassolituus sp. LLYu03]|uniref:methyl-accepting chemotaxis protein n=1 Tax=Thalassolituus sp. LLYu03 TaxID=3421656 RepID=UPI003D26D233